MSKDAPKLRFRAKRQHTRVIWNVYRRALLFIWLFRDKGN